MKLILTLTKIEKMIDDSEIKVDSYNDFGDNKVVIHHGLIDYYYFKLPKLDLYVKSF